MTEATCYVGTNMSYAKYNEFGTGIYADNGAGKQGFWVFVPGSEDGEGTSVGTAKVYTEAEARRIVAMLKAKGLDAHMTQGMKPIHFLKRAIEEHAQEYFKIMEKYISKASSRNTNPGKKARKETRAFFIPLSWPKKRPRRNGGKNKPWRSQEHY